MNHAAWLAGFILTLIGVIVAVSKWRESRYQNRKRREKNDELLQDIHKELHPNGGSSMADRTERIEEGMDRNRNGIKELVLESKEIKSDLKDLRKSNEDAHEYIHKRIDGLMESVSSCPKHFRTLEEKHQARREE